MSLVLVLHNIRSVHNVGSIFRTADAAGVAKIILSGYTPAPVDRFGRERKDVAKVALGAQKNIPWSQAETLAEAVSKLRASGHTILALEQDKKSINLFEYGQPASPKTSSRGEPKKPLALILGNEPDGLSQEELSLADTILEIPMRGKKESLNVSVAAGIALFALIQK